MILIRGAGQPERLAALQAGTIDGILLSAPATLVAKRSGLRVLIELADLEGEYPQTVFTTTRRFLQKQSPAAEGFVKGIVEAIAVAKLRKDIAIQVIGRRLKMSDREAQEEVYREVVEKGLGKKPYPTAKGLKVVLDELASQEPRFAKSRPEEFIDSNVVRTLDHSGFIDALYR